MKKSGGRAFSEGGLNPGRNPRYRKLRLSISQIKQGGEKMITDPDEFKDSGIDFLLSTKNPDNIRNLTAIMLALVSEIASIRMTFEKFFLLYEKRIF